MKLPFAKPHQRTADQPRQEPRLELRRDSVAGSGPCERARSVPEALRPAVTESCPRCGAGGPGSRAACILQDLELDLRKLDEEHTARALRDLIGRLEPRLV